MKTRKVKSFNEFQNLLETNTDVQEQFRNNPIEAVKQFSQKNPLSTDKWIYRIVVIGLSLTIILLIIGVLILTGSGEINGDTDVPTILTAIGSAAIGALAGLLSPPSKEIKN